MEFRIDGGVRAGDLVRQRRLAHGLSQRALALRAGTRQSTISRIETGAEVPTVDRLDQLLIAMGERLTIDAVPLEADRPAADMRSDRDKTVGERLEDGFALSAFASRLAGQARR